MLTQRPFGTLPTGQFVDEFTLTNKHGLILRVITYGGIVTQLHTPDRHGNLADIVLGFDNLPQYLAGHPYFGATIGRVAGRITKGTFTLDNKTYHLATNNGPNHLHGGLIGFDKRLWHAEPLPPNALRLTYTSPAGEENYPGTLHAAVTYQLTDQNEFIIHYDATTDAPTPYCPTNHSYFNLAGEGTGTIDDHILQIHAPQYIPTDANLTLLGHTTPVIPNQNDFTSPARIGDRIPHLQLHHGDTYLLQSKPSAMPIPAATLTHPPTGRAMHITTTEPCLQFYTGLYLDGTLIGKSNRPYTKHAALCLECQNYADAPNAPHLANTALRPGRPYHQTTVHTFTTTG